MEQIKFDKRNYRKHNDRNKELIAKSLEECGAGRSILIDADDSIIAGNGVYEQASKQGIPVRIIETDGTELIAVKRTDIGENDDKRRRLALADNATSDASEWDVEAIQADISPIEMADWDIQVPELEEEAIDFRDDKYESSTNGSFFKVGKLSIQISEEDVADFQRIADDYCSKNSVLIGLPRLLITLYDNDADN